MHNKFLDTMRFNQRWQWTDETEIDNYFESECNESKLIEQQTAECVCKAMASLPFEQREVIALVDLQGFSYQQVSDITATPVGTVMSHSIETYHLHAYLDGELSADECLEVEKALENSAEL